MLTKLMWDMLFLTTLMTHLVSGMLAVILFLAGCVCIATGNYALGIADLAACVLLFTVGFKLFYFVDSKYDSRCVLSATMSTK